MRIIAGEKRGLMLAKLEGESTRPTKDRVREAIFSSIQNQLKEAKVLDLFAGTGAMGLEALSRGGLETTFIEKDASAHNTLKTNISKCGYQNRAIVYKGDVFNFLATVKESYDIIFLDPPYEANLYEKILNEIFAKNVLKDRGIIIVESKKNTLFLQENRLFLIHKEKLYGKIKITYLKHWEDKV